VNEQYDGFGERFPYAEIMPVRYFAGRRYCLEQGIVAVLFFCFFPSWFRLTAAVDGNAQLLPQPLTDKYRWFNVTHAADYQALWATVLDVVKATSAPTLFQSLFSVVHPHAFDGCHFTIRVASPLIADWVDQRYRALIEETLSSLCGRPIALKLFCDTNAPTPPVTSPPPATAAVASPAPKPRSQPATLNAHFRFETFVIGSSNQMAHAAAFAAAQKPGTVYNPLFIYGGVGLGKTHLMHAIGHAIHERATGAVVHYVSCERFTNQYIEAIHANALNKFRDFFRVNVDVLLIDDIQFLSNKERTQEEFYHTFNDLRSQGKQIVMTSDKSPQELHNIEQRMVNRFECGMVVDIQSPDFETRVAIIQKKLEQYGTVFDNDVCFYIANKVRTDVRKLEGALIRLLGFASVHNCSVSLDVAKDCLQLYTASQAVTLDAIQKAVAAYFDLRIADLRSAKRPRAIAHPRQVAMYLCRELTAASLVDIAQSFGGKDHTTVLYACRKIAQLKSADEMINQQLQALKRRLGNHAETCE